MREVERLSAYEPPASIGFDPTDAQIRACPVSLCFSGGATTILANTAFAGRDFSGRFGNYFTHALVTDTPEREFGPVLPIETWQAPFWARGPSNAPELPPLAGPLATGPIDRRALRAYLGDHPQVSRLSRVLTAAALSISGSRRSVLLCATDATDNA